MKKRITELFLLVLTVLLLASCSTSVALSTLVPAEIDVGGYKTIAVQSAKIDCHYQDMSLFVSMRGDIPSSYTSNLLTFSHYSSQDVRNVLSSTSSMFVKAMNAGFYNVISTTETDAMVVLGRSKGSVRNQLMNENVDAIVSVSVSDLYFNEYITSETLKNADSSIKGYNFYLNQTASLVITFTVTDVKNNSIIAVRTLSNTNYPYTNKVRIGHTDDKMNFVKDYPVIRYADSIFESIISSFSSSVRSALTPNYITVYFDLASNKPKVKSLEAAYDFVDDGYYTEALRLFLEEWNRSGNYAAGYNASIMYYALGDYNNAFTLSEEVYRKTGKKDAYYLYQQFMTVKSNQDAAAAQINATESSAAAKDDLVGF